MHNGIGAKFVAQPSICAEVVMCRNQVAAVVDRERIFAEAAWWLDHDEHVAEPDPGDVDLVSAPVDTSWRFAPGFGDCGTIA